MLVRLATSIEQRAAEERANVRAIHERLEEHSALLKKILARLQVE